jgi:copper chaperone
MVSIQVGGMSCQHCVQSIKSALLPLGIDAQVDLQNGTVSFDNSSPEINLKNIKTIIEELGYDVENPN